LVLSLVNGEVNKKVLMPNLIVEFSNRLIKQRQLSKEIFRRTAATRPASSSLISHSLPLYGG
jgi:hypothetical protein